MTNATNRDQAQARLPVVDTHVHFWDLSPDGIGYAWLDPSQPHPLLNADEVGVLVSRPRTPADFTSDVEAAGVTHVVHEEAASSVADPVEETRWLWEQSKLYGLPHFIVGRADLTAPDLAATLDRHCETPTFVGIRDLSIGDRIGDPAWRRGFALLGERNLLCCLNLTWPSADDAISLARENPRTTVVVDHMMLPLMHDDDYFRHWRDALTLLAQEPNVVCKISEFTMVEHRWDASTMGRWVNSCLELFDPERCMVGSNWPMAAAHIDYPTIIEGLRGWVSDLSPSEQAAVLSATAIRLFGQSTRD